MLADELRKTKREAIHTTLKENADLLRFFVKSTLLEALQEAVKNGEEFAPVVAPETIRHLFEQPGWRGGHWDMDNPNSPYKPVWDELKEWADKEGLYISYAGTQGWNDSRECPTSMFPWTGFLGIKTIPEPKPERPIPPVPQVVSKGIRWPVWAMYFSLTVVIGAIVSMVWIG